MEKILNLNKDYLINWYLSKNTEELIKLADDICRKTYQNKVYLRGLIEFSNICSCDCLYCGIRKSNKNINRYILSNEQIENIISIGIQKGLKTFVLQSGENESTIPDKISSLLHNIRKKYDEEIAITLSCGVYPKEVYKQWKKDGANRYLLRFETSNEKLFEKLCPSKSFSKRIKALEDLKSTGYEVGSGFMVGLPGETIETRIENILFCKEFDFDMVGIGPFLPNKNTPLKDEKPLDIDETIRLTAMLRIFLPFANIPATTAAGTLDPLGREKMLMAGANVLMPNITPTENKKDYLLYPNKICLDEDGIKCLSCLEKRVNSIGKILSFEKGNSKSWENRLNKLQVK
ncbi:MAG TPA: [FeFe] hydrogenase H-cluster radical SAM maturase HydE [Exilispira sp.]|nr:[FeFe] hydrogenase H-cluster radical SAM maturase HydE [Exilispira sp.]